MAPQPGTVGALYPFVAGEPGRAADPALVAQPVSFRWFTAFRAEITLDIFFHRPVDLCVGHFPNHHAAGFIDKAQFNSNVHRALANEVDIACVFQGFLHIIFRCGGIAIERIGDNDREFFVRYRRVQQFPVTDCNNVSRIPRAMDL